MILYNSQGGRFFSVIDIGSNSIKMSMGKITSKGYSILIEEKEPLRLLQANEEEIPSNRIEQLITILKHFADLAHGYESDIKVIATSAMRRAKNKDTICQMIRKQTDLVVDIISGDDEAEYIVAATLARFDIKKGKYWIIDLGGGSAEAVLIDGRKIAQKASIPLGSVVVKDTFFSPFPTKPKDLKDISNQIEKVIKKNIENSKCDQMIVSGGTPSAVAKVIQSRKENFSEHLHGMTIKQDDLESAAEKLLDNGFEKLVNRYGISQSRADLVLPSIVTILAFLEFAKEKKYTVSRTGLREGVICTEYLKMSKAV